VTFFNKRHYGDRFHRIVNLKLKKQEKNHRCGGGNPLHRYDFFSHFVSLFSQFDEIELRNAFYWKRSRGLLRASPHVVFWTKFVHFECEPRPARFAFKMNKFCSVFDIRRCSKLIWLFFATGCVVDCSFTPGCVNKFKLKSICLTPVGSVHTILTDFLLHAEHIFFEAPNTNFGTGSTTSGSCSQGLFRGVFRTWYR